MNPGPRRLGTVWHFIHVCVTSESAWEGRYRISMNSSLSGFLIRFIYSVSPETRTIHEPPPGIPITPFPYYPIYSIFLPGASPPSPSFIYYIGIKAHHLHQQPQKSSNSRSQLPHSPRHAISTPPRRSAPAGFPARIWPAHRAAQTSRPGRR